MVTQEDIAKKLGISRTTVARALSGNSISEKTRLLVLEEARRMGYVPNGAATSLAMKKERNVHAFILATIDEGYGRQMSEGIAEISNMWAGYNFNIHVHFTDITRDGEQRRHQLDQVREVLEGGSVDGVILSALCRETLDYATGTCKQKGIPLMTLDTIYKNGDLCHVGPDYFLLGTYSAAYIASLMMERGRILTLSYDEGYEIGMKRMEGFHSKLADYPDITCTRMVLPAMCYDCYEATLDAAMADAQPVAVYANYHVDYVGMYLNKKGLQHKIITISNGINSQVETYLFDGTINGIVSARPYFLGAVAANNFFKYFYRTPEMLLGIVDVACDIYIKENYKRHDKIY